MNPEQIEARAQADEAKASADPYARAAYRWYAMVVMIMVYTCHAMDRRLPGILIEPIRHEFDLSDSQLGLISGTGYGLAFALGAIPLGLLTDRVNRRNLLAAILMTWSACTAFGGFAANAVTLILARMGVGAAESGAISTGMPMLSDIFPPHQRTFAFGIFYMNAPLGVLLASGVGGFVAAHYGWRAAFLVVGGPGVLIALLLLLTVKEPIRGGAGRSAPPARPAPLASTLRHMAGSPALLCLSAATVLVSLISITLGAWMASFFMRVHGLSLPVVGLTLGLGGGLCAAFSPPLYGWVADRLARRDRAWTLRILWISLIGALVSGLVMLFTPWAAIAIAAYVLGEFMRAAFPALTFAEITTHSPVPMRGSIMSIIQLLVVGVGFGLGPWITGFLSDVYGGGAAIRYALAYSILLFVVVIPLYIAASHFLYGGKRSAS